MSTDIESSKNSMPLREYIAVVWAAVPGSIGKRDTFWAVDLKDAVKQLQVKYGGDAVFTMHNEEDADAPRDMQPGRRDESAA